MPIAMEGNIYISVGERGVGVATILGELCYIVKVNKCIEAKNIIMR